MLEAMELRNDMELRNEQVRRLFITVESSYLILFLYLMFRSML